MLTVWGRRTSSNVQALMWCIGELKLPYTRVDAGFVYGVVDTPEYRAMNPNATVPTLRDGDQPPIFETGAILRYLANRHAGTSFWPRDDIGRGQVDQWAEWSKINIALNFTAPIFWRVVRTAPSMRDPEAIESAIQRLGKFLDIADSRLARTEFLVTDHLTLADIQFGHVLYRYYDIDIERPRYTHLRRYYDGLTDRAAYREHVMIDYEELRVPD